MPAGQYRLTRLSDGTTRTVTSGDVVDGFRIDIAAPLPAARDRFLLQPVSTAARDMARVLDDPKGIAAASPVAATTGTANTGTAAIASLAAVSPSINPDLVATITFTDDLGNYSYSLVDTHRDAADGQRHRQLRRRPADLAQRLRAPPHRRAERRRHR